MTAAELFALFILGHFLGDYPLQNEFIAHGKSRAKPIPGCPWYHVLTAHAVIHGGFVALAVVLCAMSGHPGLFGLALPLAVFETAAHWLIDDRKCSVEGRCRADETPLEAEKRRGAAFSLDQALHVSCKIAWTAVAVAAAGMPLISR